MKIFLTCDANWESRVDRALDRVSWVEFNRSLETRDYGNGLREIVIVFMCRDPTLNFKKRLRFVKKDKILYSDIMLDLDQMERLDDNAERKKVLVEKLSIEIPALLQKYSFRDFDTERFITDFGRWIESIQ